MHKLRALDARLATVEGAIATAVLLAMIAVAALQALLFNVAEHGVAWAARLLDGMGWVDAFLQKGTLWLAFLGASLATYENKHIGIDALVRLSTGRTATLLRVLAALCSAVIACLLAFVFYRASLASDATPPVEYEILTGRGRAHICDAVESELGARARPGLLCALRATFGALGIPISTGAGAAQLVAPALLLVIAVRLLGRALALAGEVVNPKPASERQ
jgi:TRAP-type C4-dicarboxylate transport system permease small subunit